MKQKADILYARWFYYDGMAFNKRENPYFLELFELLRGYKPPTRQSLASVLLDMEKERIENLTKEV